MEKQCFLLLGKFIEDVSEEIDSGSDFEAELKNLRGKSTMILAQLRHYERYKRERVESMSWLMSISHTIYEGQSLLEYVTYQKYININESRPMSSLYSNRKLGPKRHINMDESSSKTADKIEDFYLMLDHVFDDGIDLGLAYCEPHVDTDFDYPFMKNDSIDDDKSEVVGKSLESEIEVPFKKIGSTHPFSEVSIVGRDADRSKVVDMLLQSNTEEPLSIVAIAGRQGIGKTTLARMVYEDKSVMRRYNHRIWVSAADFSVTRILKGMLDGLMQQNDCETTTPNIEDHMIQRLTDIMQGDKYLLVLDNVTGLSMMELEMYQLRQTLLQISASKESRILLTARIYLDAASQHNLKRLSYDESWSIFHQRAFASGGPKKTAKLEAIGKKIMKRCGGIPFALKVLGAVLHSKGESEWFSIEKSKSWWNFCYREMPPLEISVNLLPVRLQHCFLYCSIFSKDFKLEKNNLIQLWIAEGFIQPHGDSKLVMEDVGNDYFTRLLSISFFQDIQVNKYGNITHCKMHGLAHDFAKYISIEESLECQTLSLTSSFTSVPDNFSMNIVYFRVLILKGYKIKVLPNKIGELQNLRYLDVSNTEITTFPASVTNLYNLQTLRLMDCERFEEFPEGIEKLVSLRHLCCNYYGELPSNIRRLKCLQTLPYFHVGKEKGHQIKELGPLYELGGELELLNLELVRDKKEANEANLSWKKRIEGLLYMWNGERKSGNNDEDVLEGLQPPPHLKSLIIRNFLGGKFPSWMKMMNDNGHSLLPQSLVTIELINCKECERIPSLGELPFLKHLKICGMHKVKFIGTEFYSQNEVEVSDNNNNNARSLFPSLEEFYLEEMENLLEWTEIADGSVVFPRLQKLFIEACYKLTTTPSHFPCLKELHILFVVSEVPIAQLCSKETSLKTVIVNVQELTSLPKEIFQNNKTNLTSLSIDACVRLRPDGLLMLTSLECLKIKDCPNLMSIPSIDGLTSLQTLHISTCGGIANLPNGLGTSTPLQTLLVDGCPNFISISEEDIKQFKSFSYLRLTRPIKDSVPTEKTAKMSELRSHEEEEYFPCDDGLTMLPSADDALPTAQTDDEIHYQTNAELFMDEACELFYDCPEILPIPRDIVSQSCTKIDIEQLKLSYDRLKDAEMKSVFLYSAFLISKNHKIKVSTVIECCIQASLIDGDLEDARKIGHIIVEHLVRVDLLQRNEDDHSVTVTMHDVTRNFALTLFLTNAKASQFLVGRTLSRSSLASEGNPFLFKTGVGLTEPPTGNEWEESNLIFMMANDFSSLPETPSCPNLLALFLPKNSGLRVIPTSFFDSMPSLLVLNLSETRIKSLPQSLSKLINLRAFILRNCECLAVLPSEVGCLEKLEILDLQGTELFELPNEVGKLIVLKHLEVSFYGSPNCNENVKLPQELIPLGTIKNLANLEKLSVIVYPGEQRWSKFMNYVIDEVAGLTNLTLLSVYFPEVKFLKRFLARSLSWRDKRLTKFKFIVGHNVQRIVAKVPVDVELDYDRRGKSLRFVNIDIIPGEVLEVLNRTTAFYLDHHLNIGSLSELGLGIIKSLEFCIVRECPQMLTIIDGTDVIDAVLPCLERLSIHYLWNLKTICEKIMPSGSFARLRKLSVHKCPHLSFIFSYSMLQCVANLEELAVDDCPAITEILNRDSNINADEIILPRLKKLKLHDLPRLVDIWRGRCPLLEQMSFYNCSSLKNIGMDSSLRYSLPEIKAEKEWWDNLEWDDESLFLQLQDRFIEITDDDF